ncbi:MAG: glutathione S-transferase N-terminal domain-containing protein [Desulfuromonadales bacterium]|nr:glutathione S-transferase N-terminal domain-containing protein [Desulfuromonadales bacterium]
MIDLYYWPTPNGHKITIFLEEAGIDYQLIPVNIWKGDQYREDFLRISPNNKIPAIVDRSPADGGEPLALFESGAILIYLADKCGCFIPQPLRERTRVIEWLMWQLAGFGPMLGQNHHFSHYAPEKIPYAVDRYRKETERLYGVLDDRLADRDYVAGAYSIADMAIYPWTVSHEKQGQTLQDYPHVMHWYRRIEQRPAVRRAYRKAEGFSRPELTEEVRAVMFGQGLRKP